MKRMLFSNQQSRGESRLRKWVAWGMWAVAGGILVLGVGQVEAVEQDVAVGDTIAQVKSKVGEPEGQFQQGKILTFYYSRGLVELLNGRVVKSTLVSSAEASQIQEMRAREEEADRLRAESEKNRLIKEGNAALQKQLADKQFSAQPASVRLAFWKDFGTRYPYTDIKAQIIEAEGVVAKDQQRQQQGKDLVALKERDAEIEARLKHLDADYAASLAHWKRNEINAERAKLKTEQASVQARIRTLEDQLGVTTK